jgi:hypothetical protein
MIRREGYACSPYVSMADKHLGNAALTLSMTDEMLPPLLHSSWMDGIVIAGVAGSFTK